MSRIVPKRPQGSDSTARWMQWAHDELKELSPIFVKGQQMGGTARGQYVIERTSATSILPPVIRVSANMMQYLFDNYELEESVYDGILGLQGMTLLLKGGHLPYLGGFGPPSNTIIGHPADTINLKIDKAAGVWTLTVAKNEDPPFYTGTRTSGPLGDYSGEANPVDPVTVTENILWQVKTDDAFLAWIRSSNLALASLPANLAWNGRDFGAATSSFSRVVLQHLVSGEAPVFGGPTSWYFTVLMSAGPPPLFQAFYERDAGDGPDPYGTYSLATTLGSPPSPPATLTISAASNNAPFDPG